MEYAVGNKQFTTATLVATVLATAWGGGGLVRTIERVHNSGIYWIILSFSSSFSVWIISPLALRMGAFMRHLSLPETIGKVYGKYARVITALSSICASIALIAGQINVMSLAIRMCIDLINPQLITIFATLILIFYSMFGGIRAVTFTDVLQFVTFTVIIPLLAYMMLRTVDKPLDEAIAFLQVQEKFQFSSVFHFDTKLVGMIALILSNLMSYIDAPTMQRVYMCSGPIQARRVFLYSTLFSFVITIFIILVAIFVFIRAPELPVSGIWDYIIVNIPSMFKGLVSISLLAMTMSTADSCLNASAVMVSHDILETLRGVKDAPYAHQIRLARITVLVVGIFGMILAFCYTDLLNLFVLALDLSVPIITAPFILAIFGFRGSSRTALIGMTTGVLTILAWNRWVEPSTEMDGSFLAMLANGLAMMAAHYLLKQPEGAGWVKPDNEFKQMQQVNARKQAERKEAIKNSLLQIKSTLAKLQPSYATLTSTGLYVVISNLLTYFIASITDDGFWLIAQLLVGGCFLGYSTFVLEKAKPFPGWMGGLLWVIGVSFCLPVNVLWHWWHGTTLFLTLGLSLAHLAVSLLVLPLYLGIVFLIVTLLMVVCLSSIYAIKPLVLVLSPSHVTWLLLLCLGLGLLIFSIFIYLKGRLNTSFAQVGYLKHREKLSTSQKFKESLYDSALVATTGTQSKGNSSILVQVVGKIEESISFLDSHMPLYKEDFQSIINKLYDWVAYFNKREKSKHHALLQPTQISLDKLVRKVEVALSQEVAHPPRLFVEKISNSSGRLSSYIICDIHQAVYALVQAVLRVSGKLEGANPPVIRIQLHPTALQFKRSDPIEDSYPSFMLFQAIAFVVSEVTVPAETLPKVKELYDDTINAMGPQGQQEAPPSIDLQQETISTIVGAHYGYVVHPVDGREKAMLLVVPNDVTEILRKITVKLPIDCLTSETPVTPKEQADSMMVLMQFHDYVCKASHNEDPIDIATISGLLLLLRQYFGFKRHASGQLFYVRAVGITTLVVEWVFHSPKVIYAALLYELVRHTCLPLSYIKAHYNLGVYAFVWNVVGIDKRQALDHPSLLYVQNRLKEALKEDHVQLSVLFIKLAERLYDLRHASGYMHLGEVAHMAQETLAIDVHIANAYLGPEIGVALENAAKEALELGQSKDKEQDKRKDQDR